MHAMMASMWFLMAMPFAFVLIAVLWYRGEQRRRDPDHVAVETAAPEETG
jgi:cbb3-type cytochrome oxidase subunit 3